ncbi:MAG TPA: hypothetical protein V6C58_14280 [Allocoleopsis sp.]
MNPSEVDFSELKFSKTKKSQGRRFILAYYMKKPLVLKINTPIKLPFGAQLNKYSQIEVTFPVDVESSFKESMNSLDSILPSFSENWFDDDSIYTDVVKNGMMTVKVDTQNTSFFDVNSEYLEMESTEDICKFLSKGSVIKCSIKMVGIWIMDSNRYGVTWKFDQIKLESSSVQNDSEDENYDFSSSDSEDCSDVDYLCD